MGNSIAVCIGNIVIYWNSIVIVLSILLGASVFTVLYLGAGGYSHEVYITLPAIIVLSALLGRLIHYYCHEEQYGALRVALRNFSTGGFCMPGVIIGILLSVLVFSRCGVVRKPKSYRDALAVGTVAALAGIRLSAMLDSTCRGKMLVPFQTLPLGSAVTTSQGLTEYRFATFFVESLVLAVAAILLLLLMIKNRNKTSGRIIRGDFALIAFVMLGSIELVCDSTRYDSSYLHSNGFISVNQIFFAAAILFIFIVFLVSALQFPAKRKQCMISIAMYLISLCGVGGLEYLVQRHGNWALPCYIGMLACCALMAYAVCSCHRTASKRNKAATPNFAPEP